MAFRIGSHSKGTLIHCPRCSDPRAMVTGPTSTERRCINSQDQANPDSWAMVEVIRIQCPRCGSIRERTKQWVEPTT